MIDKGTNKTIDKIKIKKSLKKKTVLSKREKYNYLKRKPILE